MNVAAILYQPWLIGSYDHYHYELIELREDFGYSESCKFRLNAFILSKNLAFLGWIFLSSDQMIPPNFSVHVYVHLDVHVDVHVDEISNGLDDENYIGKLYKSPRW